MKISQTDGTLLGPQKVFAAAGQFSSIERKNDLVILYTANAQLVLDTNLTVIKGFQYTTADPTRTLTLKGFSSESGRFMQGDAMTVSGDNFSYLAEFDENGKVIQAYKYPEVFPNSLNVTASRTTNDLGVFAASVTFSDYFNNFSLKDIFIIRTDGLLQIPNCPRISFPTKSTPPTPLIIGLPTASVVRFRYFGRFRFRRLPSCPTRACM